MKPYIILLMLIIAAFANSMDNSFVWDDYMAIADNPNIDIPAKGMLSLFTAGFHKSAGAAEYPQAYYRPVLSLYFILNYKIWGANPTGFHIANIILYAITIIFLYRTGLILFTNSGKKRLISLAGAAVFAVHPVNSAMAGRAASGEILLGFFIILSLYFFLSERKYLSLFTFAFALLSKETAIMLPFALVILSMARSGLKKGLTAMIPYIMLIGAYLISRTVFTDTIFGGKIEKPALTQILTMLAAALDYTKLFSVPYPLNIHYPARWYTSLFEPKVMVAILVLISASMLIYRHRKDKTMLFLFLSPYIILAPVIWRVNTFAVGLESEYIAERFLYVPAMLFSLLISAYSVKLAGKKSEKKLIIAWALIIVLFTVITISSNRIWKDEFVFFNKIIQTSPDTAFAHNNLGVAYYNQGKPDEAIKEYLSALKINPYYADAHTNIGNAYGKQGDIDKAINEYLTALKIKPDNADAHNGLGIAYGIQGHIDKAVREFEIALYIKPGSADAHNNLGIAYGMQGHVDKAINEFATALKIKPGYADAHNSLGNLYADYGKCDKAVSEYLTVLRIKPDHADARNNLGICYAKTGRINEAANEFKEALRLNPQDIAARNNLEMLRENIIKR